MKRLLITSSALLLLGAGCSNNITVTTPPVEPTPVAAPEPKPEEPKAEPVSSTEPTTPAMKTLSFPGITDAKEVSKNVRIKTTLGDIVIQVMPDQGPNAASNFVYLVKEGFYTGTIFHRVIPGFMIQGGDPTGTGMGGPGYQFPNDDVKVPYNKGIVAMANAGRDTNGSQFFIMVENYPLPPDYSIFGKVVSGQDVADKIATQARDRNDRPASEVKMESVTIE